MCAVSRSHSGVTCRRSSHRSAQFLLRCRDNTPRLTRRAVLLCTCATCTLRSPLEEHFARGKVTSFSGMPPGPCTSTTHTACDATIQETAWEQGPDASGACGMCRAHSGPLIKAHECGRGAGGRHGGQRPSRRRVHLAHDCLQRGSLQSAPCLMRWQLGTQLTPRIDDAGYAREAPTWRLPHCVRCLLAGCAGRSEHTAA